MEPSIKGCEIMEMSMKNSARKTCPCSNWMHLTSVSRAQNWGQGALHHFSPASELTLRWGCLLYPIVQIAISPLPPERPWSAKLYVCPWFFCVVLYCILNWRSKIPRLNRGGSCFSQALGKNFKISASGLWIVKWKIGNVIVIVLAIRRKMHMLSRKWRNRGLQRFHDLPQTTQLVSDNRPSLALN